MTKSSRNCKPNPSSLFSFSESKDSWEPRLIVLENKSQHLYREAENENEEKECFMREDQVWAIFRCLVMALKVLDHGREQGGKSPDYTHPPLVHLDIKPQNCKNPRFCFFELHDYKVLTAVFFSL